MRPQKGVASLEAAGSSHPETVAALGMRAVLYEMPISVRSRKKLQTRAVRDGEVGASV
jgi:hypothetical protein